ncbi:MAG: Transcriptional regulator, GntR family [Clostridiales bacterium 38_11]|nr:MAG: Transcriptional regulator, GntR family [Clostridiales bacterium 38_11]HBH13745.1 GntR family transcriptional regulator [Clostridiales bacterium]
MISFDQNSSKPIYEQIYEQFVKLISNKVLKTDEQLPSVRDLASSIRINPNTIQRAYKLLESKNYIYSVPGKGNFVSKAEDLISAEMKRAENQFIRNIKDMKILGITDERVIELTQMTLKGVESDASSKFAE